MLVTTSKLYDMIIQDFGIEPKLKVITNYNQFPIKNGKRKINSNRDSIIVDKQGLEHLYMINQNRRNEEKLIEFDHIYYFTYKSISQIIKEAGIILKSEPCKICEGNGWYSKGERIFYKNVYCEL